MASSASSSVLRQLLDERFTAISAELDAMFTETRGRARRDCAEQLNQAVRRIRQSVDSEQLAATLVDAAGLFATAVAFLRIDEKTARGERIRGVPAETMITFPGLEIPLASAAALAGAVETRDPVTAVPVETEVSPELARVFGHSNEGRVTILPLEVRGRVRAVLYCSGDVEVPAAELLCQVAAASWAALEPVLVNIPAPAPPPDLVQLVAPEASRPSRPTWESLPAAEQQVHLKAQRYARVEVAAIRLHDGAAVLTGRAKRDLYGALRQKIDDTRAAFRDRFFNTCPSMVDYLHLELVRTLAQEDAELLGKDYPGPLV